MKQFILVLMIFIMVTAETVKTTDACTCDQIRSEADCKANTSCDWTVPVDATGTTTESAGSCGTPTSPPTPTPPEFPTYCLSVTDPVTNCWRTYGCAYVDGNCTHFTGCSAYVKTTSQECQAISNKCITDGTQCADAKSCIEYITEIECTQNASTSGRYQCKWENNLCRDQNCTEAIPSLNTDALCNAWLPGCLTTGRGCTAILELCNSYAGDDITCAGLRGLDGFCKGIAGGTNCSPKECSEAPETLNTNIQCQQYQFWCVTNGKGCLVPPQPPCNSYLGDKTTCFGYLGSDGYCEGDVEATHCRARACTDAPTSYNTKELCNIFKEGCETTGKGCLATQLACSGYSGTTSSCLGYIGTDGYCKGTKTIPSPCTPKLCTDADTTLKTNEDCNRFQMSCVTTGKGCISKESQVQCSSYPGDVNTCEGLIGKDGKCKGTENGIYCSLKLCSEAPTSANTNLLCSQFQNGCVTTGQGCIEMESCLNSIQQVSCEGNSVCGWKSTCVANNSCSLFTTPSMCRNNQAISSGNISIPCFWSQGLCRNLKCEDASETYNTDDQCKQFWDQCWTNSKGCLHISAPCSLYQGTQETCLQYSKKCWNVSIALETSPCLERSCSDNTTALTDTECEFFLAGCRTNGAGCIPGTSLCSEYKGTRDVCQQFSSTVNGKTTRCYNTSCANENTTCFNKQCSDNDSFTQDSDCEQFLTGCRTNGKGCIDSSLDCSNYTGTQQECAQFRGKNGMHICWNTLSASAETPCKIRECTDASIDLKSNDECKNFLSSCLTNGHGCISEFLPCSSYDGTLGECSNFIGNGMKCYNRYTCTTRSQEDVINPIDNFDCTRYLSTSRFFKGKCVEAKPCNGYPGTQLSDCQDVYDNTLPTPLKCWWESGSYCTSRTCLNIPISICKLDCDSHVLGCVYNSLKNKCQTLDNCNTYIADSGTIVQKQQSCSQMKTQNNEFCGYSNDNPNFCSPKNCGNVINPTNLQNCDDYLQDQCQFNGNKCITKGLCTDYKKSDMILNSDAQIKIQCESMISNDGNSCTFQDGGTTCIIKTQVCLTSIEQKCQQKIDAFSAADCIAVDYRCRFNGNQTCIIEQLNCSDYLIDILYSQSQSGKEAVCSWLSNSVGEPCKYISGAYCSAKLCSDKVDATSYVDCRSINSSCRWVGGVSVCVEANNDCGYTLYNGTNANYICSTLYDNFGNSCIADSGDLGRCKAKLCSDQNGATNQSDCSAYKPSCRWIGGTSCVEANWDCQYTVTGNAKSICATLTDLKGDTCFANSATTCKAVSCSMKTTSFSQYDCIQFKPSCRWSGGPTCVEVKDDCAYQVNSQNLPLGFQEFICSNLTSSDGRQCTIGINGTCKIKPICSEKIDAYSQTDCLNFGSNCRWLGGSTCVEASYDCYYTSVINKEVTCLTLTDTLGRQCLVGTNGKCKAKPIICAEAINATSQAFCYAYQSNCRWLGGSTCVEAKQDCSQYSVVNEGECLYLTDIQQRKCTAGTSGRCKARPCSEAIDATSQVDCYNFQTFCRWLGGTSTTCVDALDTPYCNFTINENENISTFCPQLKDASWNPCVADTGQKCKAQECSAAIMATHQAYCESIKPTCMWNGGVGCVDANEDCTYTIVVNYEYDACQHLKDSLGNRCVVDSGQLCKAKLCSGKIATNQDDCFQYKPSCRWIGGTSACVEANYDCRYTITSGESIASVCLTLFSWSGQNCLPDQGQLCKAKQCSDITNATSQIDCLIYLVNCRWVGGTSTCVEANYDCDYTITSGESIASVCPTLTSMYGQNQCLPDSGQFCKAKQCSDITNATSQNDCQALYNCRWVGGTSTCVEANYDCDYKITSGESIASVCPTLTSMYGQNCLPDSGQLCKAKQCSDITNATSQNDCFNYLFNCRWVGGTSTCVETQFCQFYKLSNGVVAADICSTLADYSGNSCIAGTGQTCKHSCTDIHNVMYYYDCVPRNCVWLGGTSCDEAQPNCASYSVIGQEQQIKCEQLTDSNGNRCQYSGTGQTCQQAPAITCADRDVYISSIKTCYDLNSDCIVVGNTCQDLKNDCSYTVIPINSQSIYDYRAICQGLYDTLRNPCQYSGSGQLCEARTCSGNRVATSNYECNTWKSDCQLVSYGIGCADPDTVSVSCSQNQNVVRTCENIPKIPTCLVDCLVWSENCRYTGVDFCVFKNTCDMYVVQQGDAYNFDICSILTDTNDDRCTFEIGASRTVLIQQILEIFVLPIDYLIFYYIQYKKSCQWTGSVCVDQNTCDSYRVSALDNPIIQAFNCNNLIDQFKQTCAYASSGICTSKTCTNITPSPRYDIDCIAYLHNCLYSRQTKTTTTCLDSSAPCSQYFGTAAECKQYLGINRTQPCWSIQSDQADPINCIARTCQHNTTAITNQECNSFLLTCRTRGLGCVPITTDCSSFQGTETTCANFLAKNSTIDHCKAVTVNASSPCKVRTCYDEATSTTDQQCNSFLAGCVTNGQGCVPSTVPCSQFQGDQPTCSQFTGNFRRCWNTNPKTSNYCFDKKCSDDTISTTDDQCYHTQKDCVTTGKGCIENTAPCSSYSGTQNQCFYFRGNKTIPCWNTPDAINSIPCKDRKCTDNAVATTNADCDAFLPSQTSTPQCITKGIGCVDYGKPCSFFAGTEEQCSSFIAIDGPCKTQNITVSGTCTPRICSEALNTLITDAQCQLYHPSCTTNGYGCISANSLTCSSILEKNFCATSTGCSWINNCQDTYKNCSELTQFGPSLCVNTKVVTGNCGWSGSICREQICEDLPASLTTHVDCMNLIGTCTTTGQGCITKTTCSSYLTEIICKSASTTDIGNTCIWDTNICRIKECTDGQFTLDVECHNFLNGCTTNGISCITHTGFTCEALLTPVVCQKDSFNQPCLYVNNKCYNYSKCEDIPLQTHSKCQQVSPLCTTTGQKCIPITTCSKIVFQPGCVIGTDGTCGWLPTAQCQKFISCSDAISSETSICQAYNPQCISDGINCIEMSLCSTYSTEIACKQGGTNGKCQFAQNTCRLRECSDAIRTDVNITTVSGCQSFNAKTECTTDGTSCIPLPSCATYIIEERCTKGVDGLCIYAVPVGQTTGTKECRLKVCRDFQYSTNDACSVALTGAGVRTGCVSDGNTCISKAACATYTSKEACNGGGTDGLCAFTQGSSASGTCKLMASCMDANNDSLACLAKSDACNWSIKTEGTTRTTSCSAHTCTTKSSGSTCVSVPSFDLSTYTVCGPTTTGGCEETNGQMLLAATCQAYTMKTYTWNDITHECTACFLTTNNKVPDDAQTTPTLTSDGSLIKLLTTLVILAIMVA